MNKEELVKAIKAIVGRRLVFPEEYTNLPSIGESRQIAGFTQKYVYLNSKCLVKTVFSEQDDDYVKVVRRIPVCGTLYGVIDSKVELDELTQVDLQAIYNGLTEFIAWATAEMVEIRKKAAEYQRYADKYKILEKINA